MTDITPAELAARLEAATDTDFVAFCFTHKDTLIAALQAGEAERIATVFRCAKIIREMGPSSSPGALAAAIERNAGTIGRAAKDEELAPALALPTAPEGEG